MRSTQRVHTRLARWARLGAFLIAAATSIGASGCKKDDGNAPQALGCQSDRDCKGDRICVDHECMDPPTPVAEDQDKGVQSQVKQAMTTRYQLSWYKAKLEAWAKENPGKCPESFDEFVANERFRGRHKDGWQQPYILKCGDTAPEGQPFGVISLGPDGKEGTGDDLRTW